MRITLAEKLKIYRMAFRNPSTYKHGMCLAILNAHSKLHPNVTITGWFVDWFKEHFQELMAYKPDPFKGQDAYWWPCSPAGTMKRKAALAACIVEVMGKIRKEKKKVRPVKKVAKKASKRAKGRVK